MASMNRTSEAILDGCKTLIARHGISGASMSEIADEAEVSRATLYNHHRDKESVLRALLEREIAALCALADSDGSAIAALAAIAERISTDPALAAIRNSDFAIFTQMLTSLEDSLFTQIRSTLNQLVGQASCENALRWLLGIALAPMSRDEIARGASTLTA